MRRKTHCSQETPTVLEPVIKKFHTSLLRLRNTGIFKASDLTNKDQRPLPFVLDKGRTYDQKGVNEVWTQSGQSGLDKRQATVQLTLFVGGIGRVRATVIFRGKGLQISAKKNKVMMDESRSCIKEKACDQEIMKEGNTTEWENPFKNPICQNSDERILISDVHSAQQTNSVKELLKKYKTSLVNVPAGCTSRVQVVNLLISKPFKDEVSSLF